MQKRLLILFLAFLLLSESLVAQVGPGLGNLTYTSSEHYKSIWKFTEVNHYGSNIAIMHNGYLVTTFTPDSGRPPGGLLVWDVSNPRRPVQVSRIYDTRTSTFREQHAIPQHDKYVLLQDGCGFQIWDLSDPRNPRQSKRHCISGYAHDDYGSTWQMFWQAPYIFIANGSRGFDVIDATDMNNPQFVRHVTTPRQVGPIFAIGNLLITTAHDVGRGITIYDISNPRDPRLLNSYSNTENMYASMVNGNMLVTSARGNSNNAIFGTYDISDPLNIRKMATLNIGNSGEQLYNSIQDQFIFQGCQSEVVKIDASDPTQLRVAGLGSLGISGDVDHGQVSPFGNLIFVGNDHGSGSGFWVHQMQPDTKGPDVNMISPASNEVNRALTSRIGITLTDYVQIESVNRNTFMVRPLGGAALTGKYSHQFAMVNFSPDQPLLPNTTYEIVIPAGGIKDYAGNTVPKTFTSYFSTGPTGSFPPASAGTPWVFEDDKQVTLNWNRISNSTRYVIKRSTSPAGPFQTIATTTQLSYTDRSLTNETNYYYQVAGENSFGQGTASVAVRAKPAFYLTELTWTSQANGWGPAEVDQSNGEEGANDGNVITLNGIEFSRGLGVHANSTVKYNLEAKYDRFLCDIGLDDEVGGSGSVIFTVLLDGRQIYTSGLMNGSTATKTIDVSVAGGRELTLTVSQDADNGSDHASWGGARLRPTSVQTPTITAAGATTFCEGGSVVLNAGTGTGNTYQWKRDGNNIVNATSASYTATQSGSYTVTVTANSQAATSDAITVTVNVLPVITPYVQVNGGAWLQQNTAILCAGGSVMLGPQPVSATGWSWSGPNGFTSASREISLATISSGQGGVYTASYTSNGCKSIQNFTIIANSIPDAPSVNSPVSYCRNASATQLSATGSNLKWYTVSSGGTSSSTSPTPSTSAAGTTNYYVSQTTNGCESSRSTIAVTVNAEPNAPVVSSPVTYCQNASATQLSATGSNLKWYTVPSGGTSSSTSPTPSTSAAGTTNYYVSQTTNGCESSRSTIAVTVNAEPNAPIVSSPVTYCQNAIAIQLAATGSNLKWYTVPSGGTSSLASPTPSTSVAGATNYYVSQTTNGCESSRSTIAVTVNAEPNAVVTPSGPTTFVEGGSVTLGGTTGSGLSYKWFSGAQQVGIGSSYVATSPGSYRVEVTNASGCKATSSSTSVTVNPNQPSVITIISPAPNSTVIGPITITANVSDPDGGITKVEYLDGTTVIGTSSASPYSFTWNNPAAGDHVITVRVTDSHGGVTTSAPVTVTSNVTTGIQAVTEMHGVVYPNPANKEITLETAMDLANAEVIAINVLGVEFQLRSTLNGKGASIDVSSLTEGTYLLIVKQENKVLKRKITIVK